MSRKTGDCFSADKDIPHPVEKEKSGVTNGDKVESGGQYRALIGYSSDAVA